LGGEIGPLGNQRYFTCLAAEFDDGFIEYGFSAGDMIEPYTNGMSFSRMIAGFMCFRRFLRDLAVTFGGDPGAISVGLALRGTNGPVRFARFTALGPAYVSQSYTHCTSIRPKESNFPEEVRALVQERVPGYPLIPSTDAPKRGLGAWVCRTCAGPMRASS
jgi:hypothetical protein